MDYEIRTGHGTYSTDKNCLSAEQFDYLITRKDCPPIYSISASSSGVEVRVKVKDGETRLLSEDEEDALIAGYGQYESEAWKRAYPTTHREEYKAKQNRKQSLLKALQEKGGSIEAVELDDGDPTTGKRLVIRINGEDTLLEVKASHDMWEGDDYTDCWSWLQFQPIS